MRYDLYMLQKDEEKQKKTETKIKQLHREAEEEKAKNLADKLGFSYIDLRISPIDEYALVLAKKEDATNAKAAIIQKRQKELYVVAIDPQSEATKNFIKNFEEQGYQVKIFVVSQSNIKRAWDKYDLVKTKTVITKKAEIDTEKLKQIQAGLTTIKDLEEKLEKSKSSATDLLNVIIAAGLKLEVSDIHIEIISKEEIKLRFRIDGILQDAGKLPLSAFKLLLSRIKMLSGLKLNVHDAPQDGRFTFKSEDTDIEIRVSTIPAENGENVVFRVLDPKTIGLKLEDLGIQDYDFKIIEKELQKPNGMIITCGPTGSGKTTLLYAFLKKVNSSEIKIITLEDPIEYHIEGIEQTQVNEGNKAYTFANGLRSIVRQDPDIIMVGEIRDNETSEIAIQAALTGHLVFSTLHTNSASQTVDRIIDAFPDEAKNQIRIQLSTCLEAVFSQRLVPLSAGGRMAAYEVLVATSAVKTAIREGKTHMIDNIIQTSGSLGMSTLETSLIKLVKEGKITADTAKLYALRPEEVTRLLAKAI